MYKKDDDDNERETPPLTNTKGILTMNRFMSVMIVAILLVTFSAIMVQTQETRQSPGMSGSSVMRVQRSAPLMPKSMIANEEQADEIMVSEGSTVGTEVLNALDEAEKSIPDGSVEKMLVHHGSLSLQAHKGSLQSQMSKVEALVIKEDRGYIESQSSNNIAYYGGHDTRVVMDVQFRVKSQYFHETMAAIQELVGQDMVRSVSVNSQDVTDSYIDASARADTLDASRKALKILLGKATNVQDIMKVQRELNALTQQYESHRQRAVHLKKEVNYSYLSVHCEEQIPTSNDGNDCGWHPSKAFLLASSHVRSSVIMIGDTIIYALVWMIPLFVVFLAVSSLRVCVK
jgi:hypothetical protein